MRNTFDQEAIKAFQNVSKVGLVSMMDDNGYPHIAFINTLMAQGETVLTWGQFIEGLSKELILQRPKIGFLAMNRQQELWRGKAQHGHIETTGPVVDLYNQKPLFRYNSYFGISKVHFMDLQCVTEKEKLSIGGILKGSLLSLKAAGGAKSEQDKEIFNSMTMQLLTKFIGIKFISYLDDDGYPWLVPCVQARPAGKDRLVYPMSPFGDELAKIPEGTKVGLYYLSLDIKTVLVKGVTGPIEKRGGVKCGVIEVQEVYNPMPPISSRIYPPVPLEKIEEF